MRDRPFANGMEREWFEHIWCEKCVHAYDGFGLCDDVAIAIEVDEQWPDDLKDVEASRSNPLGVICTRIEPRPQEGT